MKPPVVTASALGLSRNEAGRRFPHAEDGAVLEELKTEVIDIVKGGQWEHHWEVYDLEALTSVETEHLVERGLMTPGFAEGGGEGRGFAVYGEGQASLEINGVDHVRVLGFRSGDQLNSLWSLLNLVDDRLESVLSYAFDPRWGYLVARPRQAGSGMRAYATLLLPALMLTGRLAGVAVELVAQGLGVSPLWSGAGGVVQVSNVLPQGRPETEILQQVSEVCGGIVEKERSVRKMLLRENPVQARDQIGRALGAAQQAWSMPFLEAVNLISALQAGRALGLVEGSGLVSESAFDLMTRLQPAHVVVDYMDGRTGCLESPEIDQRRAQVLREVFADTSVRPQERRDV
jgi:protein arginine kinase